jgi:regulator of sirC expression with transglutaminase-like and TPR domain
LKALTHPAEARRQFREFVENEITNENLARGALLIALEDHPQIDVEEYLALLDDLARRVKARCSPGDPPVFRLGHLHSEMFDVDGYRGDEASYYDPSNAYLDEVIERRAGLPLSLSIIFLHVAHAVGLNAAGVGLPAHFIVKVQFELNEVYVDPFHSGATLTVAEIGALVSDMTGGRMQLSSEHLRASNGRQILHRLLANLQSMWAKAGDMRKSASAAERMQLLQR